MDEFGMNTEDFDTSNTTPRTQQPRSMQSGRPERKPAPDRRRTQVSSGRAPQRRRQQAPPRPPYGLKDFIQDRRTHIGLGVVLIVVAVVMAIMTISHLAHGPHDMSSVEGQTLTEMTLTSLDGDGGTDGVQNSLGPVGAKLSQVLMTDGLGVGAFVLVVWLGLLGLSLIGTLRCRFWTVTFRSLFTAVALSIIVGLIFYASDSYTHWGGAHGRYVNMLLIRYTTWIGAIAVSVAMVGLLISVYLNPILRAKRMMNEKMEATRALRRERAERERRRRLEELEKEGGDSTEQAREHNVAFDSTNEETTVAPESNYRPTPISAVEAGQTTPIDSLAEMPETESSYDEGGGFSIDDDEPEAEQVTVEGNRTLTEASTGAHVAVEPRQTVATQGVSTTSPALTTPVQQSTTPTGGAGEPAFDISAAEEIEQVTDPYVAPGEHSGLDLPYDPRADLSRYRMPSIDLMEVRESGPNINEQEQRENKELIVNTLRSYNIGIDKIEATVGPTVTLYEIVPAEGVRIAQIKNLEDDIALSLAALGIRIIAPIPGKGTVGIEVPNREPRTVSIRSVLGSKKFSECRMKLPMAMGTTINNEVFIKDLADMPHLLVAGGSGQGKSVGLNTIIASLLYYKHPSELKLVLIDPKMVEFSRYSRLRNHYLAKLDSAEDAVVTDPMEATATLNSLCIEMDNRYRLLRDAGAVKVEEYNAKFAARQLNPEKGHRYLPYIVIIVDEFADLIMTAGKEVSSHIARIAQKARAVGMHMIIATQRPSTDVITGMIKANFLGRIAFRVQQMVDSKTILDRPGANQLIGRGDMLFSHNGKMERVQCAFIDSAEVDRLTSFIDDQMGYPEPYILPDPPTEGGLDVGSFDPSHRDALFEDCARFIVTQQSASTSSLQRRFGIGYNKAGKIMDQMEACGIVGGAQGSKPRSVLVDTIGLEAILSQG